MSNVVDKPKYLNLLKVYPQLTKGRVLMMNDHFKHLPCILKSSKVSSEFKAMLESGNVINETRQAEFDLCNLILPMDTLYN